MTSARRITLKLPWGRGLNIIGLPNRKVNAGNLTVFLTCEVQERKNFAF